MSTNKNYQSSSVERLRRLISMLTLLQTKRVVTASELAGRFEVSVRTIYRDLELLQQAGVPVGTEEGKGFSLMEGYKLPPFLFTEEEAAAVITAEKFISGNSDASLVRNFTDAVAKVKAVLRYRQKDKIELLSSRTRIYSGKVSVNASSHLSLLQLALTNFYLIRLSYRSVKTDVITDRIVEPFALFYAAESWLLLAFCRLRNDYRFFRIDRFESFQVLSEKFEPHKLTVSKYLEDLGKKENNP